MKVTIKLNDDDKKLLKDFTTKAKKPSIENALTNEEKAVGKKVSSAFAAIAKVSFILCILFLFFAVLFDILSDEFTSVSSMCLVVAIISGFLSSMFNPITPKDDYGPTWRERYEDRWS